jgi:hypothetical protein
LTLKLAEVEVNSSPFFDQLRQLEQFSHGESDLLARFRGVEGFSKAVVPQVLRYKFVSRNAKFPLLMVVFEVLAEVFLVFD